MILHLIFRVWNSTGVKDQQWWQAAQLWICGFWWFWACTEDPEQSGMSDHWNWLYILNAWFNKVMLTFVILCPVAHQAAGRCSSECGGEENSFSPWGRKTHPSQRPGRTAGQNRRTEGPTTSRGNGSETKFWCRAWCRLQRGALCRTAPVKQLSSQFTADASHPE